MQTARSFVFVSVVLLLLTGCDSFEVSDEHVDVRMVEGSIHIKNNMGRPIYYTVIGKETANVIFWAPTIDPRLEVERHSLKVAGEEGTIVNPGETEVLVHWWYAQLSGGKWIASDVFTTEILLNQ